MNQFLLSPSKWHLAWMLLEFVILPKFPLIPQLYSSDCLIQSSSNSCSGKSVTVSKTSTVVSTILGSFLWGCPISHTSVFWWVVSVEEQNAITVWLALHSCDISQGTLNEIVVESVKKQDMVDDFLAVCQMVVNCAVAWRQTRLLLEVLRYR